MTSPTKESEPTQYRQGFRLNARTCSPELFQEALAAAFDYRGNITLELTTGSSIEGYVFNVNPTSLDFWPKDDSPKMKVQLSDIASIYFSGRDTAEGKSWEAWVKKYTEENGRATPHSSETTHESKLLLREYHR